MRIAALRHLSQSFAERGSIPNAPDSELGLRLARCECHGCGAHSNAVAARDVQASCPNCGASRLVAVHGAGVILPARP